MEKINRIKTLLTIKVPEGITFVAGYFFLTMLVKLVLTTIVSHIGKTTSMQYTCTPINYPNYYKHFHISQIAGVDSRLK